MIRTALIGLGVLALLLGVTALAAGTVGAGIWLLVSGGLLVVGTAWEQHRYKPLGDGHPGPGWEDSGERFIDPDSDATVTVFTHARTGERRYVKDGDAPPAA